MRFLYSITYSTILTVFISASIIMGVQPPFEILLILDLDFEITNNGSNEVWICQIDFGNALPLVSQLDSTPYKEVHPLGIRSVCSYTFWFLLWILSSRTWVLLLWISFISCWFLQLLSSCSNSYRSSLSFQSLSWYLIRFRGLIIINSTPLI